MIKKEYIGSTVTKGGVTVVVSEDTAKVLRMIGITHVFEEGDAKKMTFPKVPIPSPEDLDVDLDSPIVPVSLEDMTKAELKEMAEELGVEGYEKMTKKQLIDALL